MSHRIELSTKYGKAILLLPDFLLNKEVKELELIISKSIKILGKNKVLKRNKKGQFISPKL